MTVLPVLLSAQIRTVSATEFDPNDATFWNACAADALPNWPFHSDSAPKP